MAAYRNDLEALSHRHEALTNEVAQKTREVAEAARVLDEQKAKLRLPVLDNIKVATPCRADWSQMAGDERVRHCGDCKKNVFNLSAMTRQEAEALIVEKNGDLCARYFQRHDGTIILKDCSVGVAQKRKRRIIAGAVAALLGGGAFLAYKLTRPAKKQPPEMIMGAVAPEYIETKGDIGPSMRKDEAPPPAPPQIESRTVEIK